MSLFTALWLSSGSSAPGATFALTEKELDALIQSSPERVTDVRALPHVTIAGKTYVRIDDMFLQTKQYDGIEAAFANDPWTDGIVYYVFDGGVLEEDRETFRAAKNDWMAVAALTFVELGSPSGNCIYVQNDTSNYSSDVGMRGGTQTIGIYNWNCQFIVAHEIGHALGLIHEHQRGDRAPYITINTGNIAGGRESQFSTLPAVHGDGDYDFDSVMHYGRCAFTACGTPQPTCDDFSNNCVESCWTISVNSPYTCEWQDSIGQRNHLSQLDKQRMAERYSGGGGEPPPNDQCSGAITLSAGVTTNGSTLNATSTNDPAPTCESNFGKGVWYRFTPASSGTVIVSTCGSDFDTVLQVYTGSCSSLSPVANGCDDDNGPDCSGSRASVSFSGAAGTTYRILAGGYGSVTGNLQIEARSGGSSMEELLTNGDFESGYTAWSVNGNADILQGSYPHNGSYYAYLADADNAFGNLFNTNYVTIPSNATSVTLKFWLNITSDETTTTTVFDTMNVSLLLASGGSTTLHTYSNLDEDSGPGNYHRKTFDVTAYAGEAVKVYFDATTDSSLSTIFRIDDVSLEATGPALAAKTSYGHLTTVKPDRSIGRNISASRINGTTVGPLTLLPSPLRLVDTRNGSGYFDAGSHYFNDTLRTYNIVSLAGGSVPGNAQAIVGRATVVGANASGVLQESPNFSPSSCTGNDLGQGTAIVNFPPSSVVSAIGATFTSALDDSGQIRMHATIPGGTVDVILDIVGYY